MGACRTGRHHGYVRALQVIENREIPCDHIDDGARDEKRRYPLGTLLVNQHGGIFNGANAANARADGAADSRRGRLGDLKAAAAVARGRQVAAGIKAFVVPGSEQVARAAEAEGLDQVFRDAGFEWREPGCSMCLAMNPDRLEGRQISASSSNRNFKGRQGSASGRTLLMSPAMVAAAAVNGHVSDVRLLEA